MAERKRIGVPISGLDTSTPDHSVVDGKCETLHNLRYTGEAWRNVKEFESIAVGDFSLTGYTNVKLLYKHPVDSDVSYIFSGKHRTRKTIYLFKAVYGNNGWTPSIICTLNALHEYKITHFGKLLLVGDSTENKYRIYQYNSNTKEYSLYLSESSISIDCSVELGDAVKSEDAKTANPSTSGDDIIQEYIYVKNDSAPVDNLKKTQGEYWRGELACIITAEDYAGNVLTYSNPIIVNTCQIEIRSYTGNDGWCNNAASPIAIRRYQKDTDVSILTESDSLSELSQNASAVIKENAVNIRTYGNPYMRMYRPKLSYEVNFKNYANRDLNGLIVKVWATTIYSLFDIEKLKDLEGNVEVPANEVCKYFADNQLFRQNFYLLLKTDLSTSASNVKYKDSIALTSDKIEKLVNQPLLKPNLSFDNLYSTRTFEYNNRLHLISPGNSFNKKTTVNANTTNDITDYGYMVIEQNFDQQIVHDKIEPADISGDYYYDAAQPYLFVLPFSTRKFGFYKEGHNGAVSSFTVNQDSLFPFSVYLHRAENFIQSSGTNSQYNFQVGTKPYKFLNLSEDNAGAMQDFVFSESTNIKPYKDTNRIQASEINSPLSYPFDNSYRIGSATNEIIAVNSAAIEMSDSKFGEFPLYVFTKEGIFAMQSGKETAYSSVVPINYDVAINPNTLAVNGAVLYFTDKGLHALTKEGAKLLSTPINTVENRIPDWMYTTQMVYLPEWNEVLCTDLKSKKAYVYSLDNKVWSTRDIPDGYILNNDELVSVTNNRIYNLRDERESIADGQASTAQRSVSRAAATTFATQRTRHTWSSTKGWGVLDTSEDGESHGFEKAKNLYLYRGDKDNYFENKELYYEEEVFTDVALSNLCIVSKDTLPEDKENGDIELLIVDFSTGKIVAKSTEKRYVGDYYHNDYGNYYEYSFGFKPGISSDMEVIGITVAFFEDRSQINLGGTYYYEWGVPEANYPFDGDSFEYILNDWYNSFPDGKITQVVKVSYSGKYDDLYYAFNDRLRASEDQPTPTLYSYNSNNNALQEWQSKELGSPIDVITYSVEDITLPYIEVSPTSSSLPSSGGTVGIKLTTNASWSASCEIEDVVITPASGEGDETISITVPETTVTRTIDILFTASLNDYTEDTSLQITQSPNSSGEDDDNNGDNDDDTTYAPTSFALTTRPIKLGSMELKRAETIIVRFECPTEQTLNVEVEGSIDTQNWKTLRKLEGVQTNKDIVIRRTPCSVKYLRFKIDGNVTDDIRILAFEVEYYNRMRHRMR